MHTARIKRVLFPRTPLVLRAALSAAIVMWLWLLTPMALASGPLISELVELEDLRRAIASDTATDFERSIKLSGPQAESSRLLIEGARTELERVINRHLRQTRAGCTYEELKASEVNVVDSARKIERQLLEDLRSLLNPDQTEGFDRFQRAARRRALVDFENWTPIPFDLVTWFRKSGIDPAADPELRSALDQYDVEGDKALVERAEAQREYFTMSRGTFDGSPEATAAQAKVRRRFDAARAGLERLQATIVRTVLQRLPQDAQDRFVRACLPYKQLVRFGSTLDPAKRPVVREVRSMKLTPEQRASVDQLVAKAERAVLDRARQCVLDNATYLLASDEYRQKNRTTPPNQFLEDAGKIEKKLDADVLALLTPRQRSEYDASPVIDPSDVSPIKPEPAER